jgi:hypothetical protein
VGYPSSRGAGRCLHSLVEPSSFCLPEADILPAAPVHCTRQNAFDDISRRQTIRRRKTVPSMDVVDFEIRAAEEANEIGENRQPERLTVRPIDSC